MDDKDAGSRVGAGSVAFLYSFLPLICPPIRPLIDYFTFVCPPIVVPMI